MSGIKQVKRYYRESLKLAQLDYEVREAENTFSLVKAETYHEKSQQDRHYIANAEATCSIPVSAARQNLSEQKLKRDKHAALVKALHLAIQLRLQAEPEIDYSVTVSPTIRPRRAA